MRALLLSLHSVASRELLGRYARQHINALLQATVLQISPVDCARYLAEVVGKAHARQMDATTRKAFANTFNVRPSAQLDAPSWLWSSVVELASAHEAAYLEHCRQFALA